MNDLNEFFNVESETVEGKVMLKAIKTNIGGNDIKIIAKKSEPWSDIGNVVPARFFFDQNTTAYMIDFDIWVNGFLAADEETIGSFLFIIESNKISIHRLMGLFRSIYSSLKLRLFHKHPKESQKQDTISMAIVAFEKTGKIPDYKQVTSSYALTANNVQYKRSVQYFNGRATFKTRWYIDVPVDDDVGDEFGVTSCYSVEQDWVEAVDILDNSKAEELLKKKFNF